MPLSSTCRNCGLVKTPDYYHQSYCKDCTEAIKEARKSAEEANADLGAATRIALAERAHNTHRNRPDPRSPISKADYWGPPRGNDVPVSEL